MSKCYTERAYLEWNSEWRLFSSTWQVGTVRMMGRNAIVLQAAPGVVGMPPGRTSSGAFGDSGRPRPRRCPLPGATPVVESATAGSAERGGCHHTRQRRRAEMLAGERFGARGALLQGVCAVRGAACANCPASEVHHRSRCYAHGRGSPSNSSMPTERRQRRVRASMRRIEVRAAICKPCSTCVMPRCAPGDVARMLV